MFHPLDGTAHRGRHLGINIGPTLDITCFKASIIIPVSTQNKQHSNPRRKDCLLLLLFFSRLGLCFDRMTVPRVTAVA